MEQFAAPGGCGCHDSGNTCLSITTQLADVSLPVRLLPYTRVGEISTECCGDPTVTTRQLPGVCRGCELVITQTVCIRIPVEYGATAEALDASVCCKKPACGPCR